MEWTRLRKMMDSSKTIKRNKRRGRKLAHKTYAYLYHAYPDANSNGEERIEIEFENKPILWFWPNNKFACSNNGSWRDQVLRSRFRTFLPWNGHISNWKFESWMYPGQLRPNAYYAWTLWMTGTGSHPWKNGAIFDINGHREDVIEGINKMDANELCHAIQAYSREASDALVYGALEEHSCGKCFSAAVSIERSVEAKQHMLEHVLNRSLSLELLADAISTQSPEVAEACRLLMKENWVMWKPLRSDKQRAARTEKLLLNTGRPLAAKPPKYKKMMRWLLEQFLLQQFGFEVGC